MITILQNSKYEEPGAILEWAHHDQVPVQIVHPASNGGLPVLDDIDALIVLGAPVSANDSHVPWLKNQRNLLSLAHLQNKKIFSICLGAQLAAQSAGAIVRTAQSPEIGWHHVYFRFDQCRGPLSRIKNQTLEVFQFHGEEFLKPEGAISFASSAACEHQGVEINETSVAFAGHLEITSPLVESYLETFQYIIEESRSSVLNFHVQELQEIRKNLEERVQRSRALLFEMLSAWYFT